MPPKKKKASKGEAKASEDVSANPETDMASVEDLNQKISMLEKEKNKEEEHRNYMQLERDKINAFWEIAKKELDDKRAELRNKDREIEEIEERQQAELKIYKQKVKHLLYEHQNDVSSLKCESDLIVKLHETDFDKDRQEWYHDTQSLKLQLREQELADQELVKQLKLDHAKEITKLKQSFELQFRQLKDIAEKKMRTLRDACELRRKAEIHEIEERKNAHINDLMNHHERAFFEIKNYYNDITHNNLDLIKTLKGDVAEMKQKEVQNEKLMYEIAQENKRLSDPLNAALKEVENLRQQLANYADDKRMLSSTKARLSSALKTLKNVEWEKELLMQKMEKVVKERDEMQQKHEAELLNFQQKASLKEIQFEKKLSAQEQEIEKHEAKLAEIVIASNLDPDSVSEINAKLEEILESKNTTIQALQWNVARITKAHNDLIRIYEVKLKEAGVPVEDLGFRLLKCNVSKGPTKRL